MRWRMALLTLGAMLSLAGVLLLVTRLEREAPAINFSKEVRFIGMETPFEFKVEDKKSGLRHIKVWLKQGSSIKDVFFEEFNAVDLLGRGSKHSRDVRISLDYEALKLDQGHAKLIVAAQDRSLWKLKGNVTIKEITLTVDTIPPRIDLISTAHNVRAGGTGLAVYRLSEKAELTGVEIDDLFFPGYADIAGGPDAYLTYFALPHDVPPGTRVILVANDLAGNFSRRNIPVHMITKEWPGDTIRITDRFLEAKMPEFTARNPRLGSDLIQIFLKINRDMREKDHQTIKELCQQSRSEKLWSGAFIQMKNSKNMAGFAQKRSYEHKGELIDQQVHLGLDLASTAGASVPAGNAGLVVMNGELGIYGQSILIDHGQGLFSFYAHLSAISANKGQKVEKGQIIGATGQTGMAGGDHLHFSILANGVFVNPIEWLDQHWITDNIQEKLSLPTPRPVL